MPCRACARSCAHAGCRVLAQVLECSCSCSRALVLVLAMLDDPNLASFLWSAFSFLLHLLRCKVVMQGQFLFPNSKPCFISLNSKHGTHQQHLRLHQQECGSAAVAPTARMRHVRPCSMFSRKSCDYVISKSVLCACVGASGSVCWNLTFQLFLFFALLAAAAYSYGH